jgi:hypothetical protein
VVSDLEASARESTDNAVELKGRLPLVAAALGITGATLSRQSLQ